MNCAKVRWDKRGGGYKIKLINGPPLTSKTNGAGGCCRQDLYYNNFNSVYSRQSTVINVYGLGLRLNIAASIDKSSTIAASVAKRQIETLVGSN